VLIGNAVVVSALVAVLGYGAFKRFQTGPVGWEVVAGWSGVGGLGGLADVFVSRWLLARYPPKQ